MNPAKTLKVALSNVELWEKELEKYDLERLLKKPDSESWSLGQVYMHLIKASLGFHRAQIETCIKSNENSLARKNFKGFLSFHVLGKFPPIKIKVPASESYTPAQPESISQIKEGLASVKRMLQELAPKLQADHRKGKTAHPGFSFLNAKEWFHLVAMHFQHHLRQKTRIDQFLQND